MVREAGQIWRQANVQIHVRGVVERTLNMPHAIAGLGARDLPGLSSQLNIRGGAIVVLVHRLSGSVHAGLAIVGGRICALQWPCTGHALVSILGNDLAHELGHILGLDDYQFSRIAPRDIQGQLAARNNLMTSSRAQGTLLNQSQVTEAQGSPWLR